MREITFNNLLNEKISLNDKSININEILYKNIREIEIYQANEHSTHLIIKNKQDTIVRKVFVKSTQRVIVNQDWQYIKTV